MSKLLNLLGTKPNQIPTNSDLGKMAFQDALSLTDDNATTSSCYPLFTDPTNGALVKTSLSKLKYTPSTGTLQATSFATASGSLVVDWKNLTAQYALQGGGTVTTTTTNILWSTRVIAIPVEMPEESASGFFDISCPISGTVVYYNPSNVTTTTTCTSNGIPLLAWEALYYQITEGQSATSDQTKFRVVSYQNSTWVPGPGWICIAARNGDDSSFKWLPGQVNIPQSQYYVSSTGAKSWIVGGATSTTGTGSAVLSVSPTVTGTLTVTGDTVISGNLTVNGTTTSINSTTLSIDDKNIELGAVTSGTISTTGTVGSITGTGPWTATITNMTTTSGLIPGSSISATAGTGTLYGGSPTSIAVATIVSSTSITYTVTGGTTPTAGTVTNITTTGNSDVTANGAGITIKAAADKTLYWTFAENRWVSNIGFQANNTALGGTLGSQEIAARFFSTYSGNGGLLDISHFRDAAGTDWTTVGTRLQQKIDTTWMAWQQFNGNGNPGGIAWGTGNSTVSPQAVSERMRIDSSGNVLIGTSTAYTVAGVAGLQVHGTSSSSYVNSTRWSANAFPPALILGKSRGAAVGTRAAVVVNDSIGEIGFFGDDATNFVTAAYVRGSVDGTVSTGVVPGRLAFVTSNSSGVSTERMRIDSAGNVGIGTTSPSAKLHVYTAADTTQIIQDANSMLRIMATSGTNYIQSGAILSSGSAAPIVFGNIYAINEWMRITTTGNVGIGTGATVNYKLQVNGSFAATTKSFVIDHPTKPDMKLRYGSLEGPENGVYIRGRLKDSNVIELPDYWTELVHEDTITVNLTAIGKSQDLWVEDIVDNTVIVGGNNINCFYTVFAERKDVEKLIVEF
jgi:hypothetical protein